MVQLTPFARCSDLEKFCVSRLDWWHLVQIAAVCRTECLEANDLRDVAAAVNVRLRRAMAGLASVLVALEQRRVRSVRKVLVPNFLVARLANFGFSVLARRRSQGSAAELFGGFAWAFADATGRVQMAASSTRSNRKFLPVVILTPHS